MAPQRQGSQKKARKRLNRKAFAYRAPPVLALCLGLLSVRQPLSGMPEARVPAAAVDEFDQALDHFRSENYAAALRVIEPLGRRHPDSAEIRHLLALILDLNRRPEEANQHFRRAVELQPASVVLRTNFGASLMRLGRASEAAEQFRKALEVEPEHPTASFNLGTILLQQGRPEEASSMAGKGVRNSTERLSKRLPARLLPVPAGEVQGSRRGSHENGESGDVSGGAAVAAGRSLSVRWGVPTRHTQSCKR